MAVLTPLQIALVLMAIVTYLLYKIRLRSKYPPGPWPLPIIGNLHQLSKKPYKEFSKLAKIHGRIFTVWLAGQPTVIVEDLRIMKEASGQKGLDFAGRTFDTVGYQIMFHGNRDLATRSYDKKVSLLRKIAVSITKATAIGGFSILKIIEEEMKQLQNRLKEMNDQSIDVSLITRLLVSNVTMRAVLNFRFESEEDPRFVRWTLANEEWAVALEKALIMSLAQELAHLMISAKKGICSKTRLFYEFVESGLKDHESTYQEGVIRDLTDLTIQFQRNQGDDTPPSEKIESIDIRGFLKDMLSAGILTTASTIVWSSLVLLYKKDIQCKIQEELDGHLRKRKSDPTKIKTNEDERSAQLLFSLSDKPDLPYLNAFIQEVLRLWPAGPIGAPHRTMVDTSLGGYSITKGTDVFFNIYGINRDETIWENPLEFIPERFLDTNGQYDYNKAKQVVSFGAGPRSCVGENLARMEIFICLANILHTFELSSSSFDVLPPLNDGHFRLDYSPYPFKAIFKLRNPP